MTYATRYYYSVVLRKERTGAGGKPRLSFIRESGYQFGLNPSAACTTLEVAYKLKNLIIDQIVLRLSSEDGQILLRTQKDDITDSLPLIPFKPTQTKHETSFDLYKFLTTKAAPYRVTPILRVKDHLT